MPTDSKLERLKVQRSVIEAQQIRAQEFLEKYASSATLETLQVRLNHVEVQFKTFNTVQESIEEINIEELKEDNRQKFEEIYFTLQPALVTLIQRCKPSPSPRKELNDSDVLQDNLVRLPKISLPTFSGEITQWTSYFESFNVLIYEQPALNELQKYQYLKSSLVGAAAAQIASLELTAKNYSVAIEILKEKYQNKRSICLAHLDTLLNIRPLLSSKPQDVRKQTDTIKVQLRALETLGRPVNNWDDILVHLIVSKLDAVLRSSWEDEVPAKRLPSLNELMTFLERKCDKLEATYRAQSLTNTTKDHSLSPSRKAKNSFIASSSVHCPICNKNRHLIYHCPVFLKLPVRERFSMIQKLKLCSNCLRHGHGNDACRSTYKCRICQVRHHSLLHPDATISSTSKEQLQSNISLHLTSLPRERSYVFLATAVIQILDIHGNYHQCRAVLDSASQVNFISSRLTTLLGLKKRRTLTPISGIGNTQNIEAKHQTATVIKSRFNNFSAQLNAIVLPTISNVQPSSYIEVSSWNIPVNIELADPNFNKPDHIDLLIGAELHYQLLQVGQISLSEDAPVLQKTLFGWIVSGKANFKPSHQPTLYSCNLTTNPLYHTDAITHELRQFWELENHLQNKPQRSLEERLCESHFLENVERDTKGHFIVKLPFKEDRTCLGDSKDMAIRRFLTLERKLHKNLDLLKEYKGFIHEYLQLGHMEEIKTLPSSNFFLPHHCVIKPESSTTNLRVVFDGSAKTTSNQCLNDILMVGPVVQQDLFAILLRFRSHRYVITADISKMYRQVRVDPSQRRYQMIVWRDSPSQQLKYFQLSTVTYGTASAPFLATRCLLQLTSDEERNFPLGSAIASKDFYVDDLLTGGNTLTDVRNIKAQVSALLQKGGFLLRKWCSNQLELLSDIPEEEREQYLQFQDGAAVKTLGLIWQPEADKFQFAANILPTDIKNITKRSVLSDIAKLFDPLGLINPIILLGKIFMQQLWQLKLDWNESLPCEYFTRWSKFREQLKLVKNIKFLRRICLINAPTNIQIHTFSDASEKAYGSCLYLRCSDQDNNTSVALICAKSRVAPLKKVTLPRLELCAAVLMTELVQRVIPTLNINVDKLFYWTDSSIVLSWIGESSSNWCTFVANRVAIVQEHTDTQSWYHIDGKDNPADCVSRGMLPMDLFNCTNWFKGPSFLHAPETKWPFKNLTIHKSTLPERRKQRCILLATDEKDIIQTCKFCNSFLKLQGVFGALLRFCKNAQVPTSLRLYGPLRVHEREDALNAMIIVTQRSTFKDEYSNLSRKKSVKKHSRLKNLNPFLDNKGIIRVGGRLENADLQYDTKHPMVLPSSHEFTRSLIDYYHIKHMHAGPQALLAILRQRFWPLNGRTAARKVVHSCIRCFRAKPRFIDQIMGNLPSQRIQPARPFLNSGVDFCGPVFTHFKIRGKTPIKTYIAIFICFATKAVHLEVASDLSTSAFIAALKRFIARRRFCENLYCDNATNFVGANAELKRLRDMFTSEHYKTEIIDMCAKDNITFHFIPPRSPHFGGLWEAAVKSAKHHLRRTICGHSLTFEDLNTAVIQIEAILNSRPITEMSSDPNDLKALTPGHFLIGEPLTAIVEPGISEQPQNRLQHWQKLRHIQQTFWKRWSKDYLSQLQIRTKWKSTSRDVTPGDLTLIKDDDLPPMKWMLGRVIQIHPGADGRARVATLKTANGDVKRAISKLCPLPIDSK